MGANSRVILRRYWQLVAFGLVPTLFALGLAGLVDLAWFVAMIFVIVTTTALMLNQESQP